MCIKTHQYAVLYITGTGQIYQRASCTRTLGLLSVRRPSQAESCRERTADTSHGMWPAVRRTIPNHKCAKIPSLSNDSARTLQSFHSTRLAHFVLWLSISYQKLVWVGKSGAKH